jgi:hypothetical protein
MAGKVTIVFNNEAGASLRWQVLGFASSGASGTIVASGWASGTSPKCVVSGYAQYQFRAFPSGVALRSSGFDTPAQVSVVFAASA